MKSDHAPVWLLFETLPGLLINMAYKSLDGLATLSSCSSSPDIPLALAFVFGSPVR